MTTRPLILRFDLALPMLALLLGARAAGCTPAAKTAAKDAIEISADVCKELDQQNEPEWIALACVVDGAAAGAAQALADGAPDAASDAKSVQNTRASSTGVQYTQPSARTVIVKIPASTWAGLAPVTRGDR